MGTASIQIFTFLYTKSRQYATKPAYPTVTCKAELRHRAIIAFTQPSVLDPCYKNGIGALVLVLLLLLQTLHCIASCTLGNVHPPQGSSCGRRGTDETRKGRGGSLSLLGQDPHSILGKIMASRGYSDVLHSYPFPSSCQSSPGSLPAWRYWASSVDGTYHLVPKLLHCYESALFFLMYLLEAPSHL